MLSVGEKSFTLMERYFLAGPENPVADAVGDIGHAIAVEANGTGRVGEEVRVVGGSGCIVAEGLLQLVCGTNAVRDNGVRVDGW